MSNTEEEINEMDENLEKVIVEEEGDQFLRNESDNETDPNLQNDNQLADDNNEISHNIINFLSFVSTYFPIDIV